MGKKLSSKEWEQLCNKWQQSGMSRKEFSKQNGVNLKTFSAWIIKLKRIEIEARGKINFLPIAKVVEGESFLEIILPNGISCKIAEDKVNIFLEGLLRCK